VQVASKLKKGTVVSVFLPEVDPMAKAADARLGGLGKSPQKDGGDFSLSPGKTNGEAIAIVDDEESIASLTKQALDTYGFRGFAFTSAQACLDHLAAHPGEISLIVTDQIMPKITGSDLIKRIRAQGIEIPAIIVSGVSRTANADEMNQLSPVGFLSKPFQLAGLVEAINQLLPQPNGDCGKS